MVGFILAAQKKHEEAIRSYQECLSIRERAKGGKGAKEKENAVVLRNMSVSCAALGRKEEAEKWLMQSEVAASKIKARSSKASI